jgi:hypothetical protein
MLEHGNSEAEAFLPQLQLAEVTPWQCPCGCASINFQIRGDAEAPPGVHILGDITLGAGDITGGAFIFEPNLDICKRVGFTWWFENRPFLKNAGG